MHRLQRAGYEKQKIFFKKKNIKKKKIMEKKKNYGKKKKIMKSKVIIKNRKGTLKKFLIVLLLRSAPYLPRNFL